MAGELLRALRPAAPTGLRAAGALAVALVEQEADGAAAGRQAAALLDAVVISPEVDLDPALRSFLEDAADGLLGCSTTTEPTAVARRLDGVLRAVAEGRVGRAAPLPLEAAVSVHLAEHLRRGAGLGDLARRLGYSPSHCSVLVRKATGACFSALRRRVMLECAIGLLRGGASVQAAALGAGFSEAAYFSRVFSRCYGVPPSRWREVAGQRLGPGAAGCAPGLGEEPADAGIAAATAGEGSAGPPGRHMA